MSMTALVLSAATLTQEAIILDCIYTMESSRGINCTPRYEAGFLKKYGNSGKMSELRKRFSDKEAASSYGPYQIMLVVAYEHGFKGTPRELSNATVNQALAWTVVSHLRKRHRGDTRAVFKAYNGSDRYADRGMVLFSSIVKER